MKNRRNNLDTVYGANGSESARTAYNNWAQNYDIENIEKGYRLPEIATALVARHVPLESHQVLDAGCGTGLVGEALNIIGYSKLIGSDLSPEMLSMANGLGVYEKLIEHDLNDLLPLDNDSCSAVVCIGSLGPGHAPSSCLEEFIRVTEPRGKIVINVRFDTYEEQGLKAVIEEHMASNRWNLEEETVPIRPYVLAEPELKTKLMVFSVP